MEPICYQYLRSNPELLRFVRFNPMWYRYLTRDPSRINEIEKEARKFYGKTIPQRLEKLSNHVQMASMLIQLAGNMKD